MSYRRDNQAARSALFDGHDDIEEGGLRASSYSSDINEHDNEKAIDTLKHKVSFLKRLTGDIHDEVLGHNRLLDCMEITWMHHRASYQEQWIASRCNFIELNSYAVFP
ncbi:Bet1-like SNARE 1-2-like protein [Drosera capensis]